ncbi:MAG: hypothetical protein AB7P04_15690 [Bacteriovoracia bacterium]
MQQLWTKITVGGGIFLLASVFSPDLSAWAADEEENKATQEDAEMAATEAQLAASFIDADFGNVEPPTELPSFNAATGL